MALQVPDEALNFPWPDDVMTVTQVAATVRMTPKTVRQHIRRGRLRAVQFDGGPYRVRVEDAQHWIERQLVQPDAGALAVDRHIARGGGEQTVTVLTGGRRRRTGRVGA